MAHVCSGRGGFVFVSVLGFDVLVGRFEYGWRTWWEIVRCFLVVSNAMYIRMKLMWKWW